MGSKSNQYMKDMVCVCINALVQPLARMNIIKQELPTFEYFALLN